MANDKNDYKDARKLFCHNSSAFMGKVMTIAARHYTNQPASHAPEVLPAAARELNGHSVQMISVRGNNA
jgi:hypothetical protein